jgi:hypothetical protein
VSSASEESFFAGIARLIAKDGIAYGVLPSACRCIGVAAARLEHKTSKILRIRIGDFMEWAAEL